MTAHLHSCSPPPLCTLLQLPQMGPARSVVLANLLVNAFWNECETCMDRSVEDVVVDRMAFLVLRRACMLQQTGQLRWAHGTNEGTVEAYRVGQFDGVTIRQLTKAGARMWVSRARLFAEIDQIGKSDSEPRVLRRPRIVRPGQRNRRR